MAKKGKKKDKKKATKPTVTELPVFYDEEGQLKTLKAKHFPNTKAGKLCYCDYQIEKWGVKKETIKARLDPLSKKRKKREKLQEQLNKLEEELKAAEAEEAKNAPPEKK